MPSPRYLLLLLLAILCPPVPVFIKRGLSQDFLLSILLTLFFLLPGIIHAVLIIYLYDEKEFSLEKGLENGRKEKYRSSYVPVGNTVVPYPPGRFQGYAASGGGGGRLSKPWAGDGMRLVEPEAVVHRGWYV